MNLRKDSLGCLFFYEALIYFGLVIVAGFSIESNFSLVRMPFFSTSFLIGIPVFNDDLAISADFL